MGTQVLLGLTLNSLFIFYNPKHFRLGADAASWRFDCCPGPFGDGDCYKQQCLTTFQPKG